MSKYKAVVFDLDGTLSPKNAWYELTSFLETDPALHLDIFQSYMDGVLKLEEAKQQLLSLWLKSKNAHKEPIQSFFAKLPLRENSKEIIDHLDKAGIETCLISSNVDVCVEEVAHRLGIKNWFSESKLIFDETGKLVDLIYTAEKYDTKLKYLIEYSTLLKIEMEECLTVGDGENDIVLFKETGGGLTIGDNVPNDLKKYAIAHINDLIEVRDYLK